MASHPICCWMKDDRRRVERLCQAVQDALGSCPIALSTSLRRGLPAEPRTPECEYPLAQPTGCLRLADDRNAHVGWHDMAEDQPARKDSGSIAGDLTLDGRDIVEVSISCAVTRPGRRSPALRSGPSSRPPEQRSRDSPEKRARTTRHAMSLRWSRRHTCSTRA